MILGPIHVLNRLIEVIEQEHHETSALRTMCGTKVREPPVVGVLARPTERDGGLPAEAPEGSAIWKQHFGRDTLALQIPLAYFAVPLTFGTKIRMTRLLT